MTKLTKEHLVTIQVLRQQGHSPHRIARTLEVDESTIRYHLKRLRDQAEDGRRKTFLIEQAGLHRALPACERFRQVRGAGAADLVARGEQAGAHAVALEDRRRGLRHLGVGVVERDRREAVQNEIYTSLNLFVNGRRFYGPYNREALQKFIMDRQPSLRHQVR